LWPKHGHEADKLQFFAFYPDLNAGANLVNATTVSGNEASIDYRINKFQIASNIADQVDFITAYTTGSMEEDMFSGINLEFKHKLSRIEVKAKSSNKSCKLEIAGVRIGGINTQGTYKFKAEEEAGDWTIDQTQTKKDVEYVYQPGDRIVAINSETTGVSIMGAPAGTSQYAMLLPDTYNDGWDYAGDNSNAKKGMFISVLLRVLDKTPGGNDKQQYPYFDNSQGLNAMDIPRVYLAVRSNGIVNSRVYKKGNSYFSDEECKKSYSLTAGEEVKEFGWAALPVTGDWKAGYAYTYTLDYTSGVGLHDPSVTTASPKAGDPIISDKVGVTVSVFDWQGGTNTTHTIVIPGS
ncbi:MAG: fimbrillin family protein, partial [Muribaculaceae bacterium]|nr:fimbrillin family protein [Muribaculaceae bacterium]